MFISLDLETTGFDPKKDKIIEFGAIKFDLDGNSETLQFLCHPGITIPEIVTHITNIKDSDLEGAPAFAEKKQEVQDFIGDYPIIGHNIQFDTRFLRENGIEIQNLEYDTHDLAAMLLPGIQSYSLEILSKIFNLQHKEKHRALDDAIAAMELFLILTKKFKSLEPQLIEKIQGLVKKSQWPLKQHLLNLEHNDSVQVEIKKAEKEKIEAPIHENTIIEMGDNSAIQIIPPYKETILNLTSKVSPDCYISIPNNLFYSIEEEVSSQIAKIDCYDHYLSPQRLALFCEKDSYSNEEIAALLKVIVWEQDTETGLLREVRLKGDELKVLAHISVNPEDPNLKEEPYIKKTLEKDKEKAAICSHSYLIEHPPKDSELIIFNHQKLNERLHRRVSTFLNIDISLRPLEILREKVENPETINNLHEKVQTLFGLVESLFEKHNDKDMYAPRCEIKETVLSSSEWKHCREIVYSLIDSSLELAEIKDKANLPQLKKWKEILTKINKVFREPDFSCNFIFFEQDRKENIVIRNIPFNVTDKLGEILSQNKSFKIIDENFLEIPKEMKRIEAQNKLENIAVRVVDGLDARKKHKIIDFIKKNSTASKKAMILNSKKELEFYTLELKQRGFNTVSQLTASTGKLEALFESTKDPLLLVTPNMWGKLKCVTQIEELFMPKIPFEPPSDAFLVAKGRQFSNSFAALSIPRSIAILKHLINKLAYPQDQDRQVYLLDSRITEKSYGKDILEKLKESYLVN